MASPIVKTPALHQVYNAFDEQGILLGLPRISTESNKVYKRRLLDVLVNKADSTYQGLINGITRELGYHIDNVMTLTCEVDGSGVFVRADPAVTFDGNMCYVIGCGRV
jgi:hypothetical protein